MSSATPGSEPVRVGLVGAGPWARMVHAPMLAAGPETTLSGVWARRPQAASDLAAAHGSVAASSLDELIGGCDAVAFAVPPGVQAELAPIAAAAGKALLLEKPLAADIAGAERVAAAVRDAGVASLLLLTYRYGSATRSFLAEAAAGGPWLAARGCFLSGAHLGGAFAASPWRQERGALLDIGPHLVDLAMAALGPVADVRGARSEGDWVCIVLEHHSGAISELSLTGRAAIDPSRTELDLFPAGHDGPRPVLSLDARATGREDLLANVRRELAHAATTREPHPLDADHGLELQRVLDLAERRLGG